MGRSGVMRLSAGLGARAVLQAALFVALARLLGPAELGTFMAVLSVMSILSYLSGLGSSLLLVRDLAASAEHASLVGRALKLVFATAPLLAGIGAGVAALLLPGPAPWVPIAAVALAEILLVPLIDLAMRLHQGLGSFSRMAAVSAAPQAARLCFLLIGAAWLGPLDATAWSLLYLLATVLSCGLVWASALRTVGAPEWGLAGALDLARAGAPLAASNVAMRATADADKSLMARWAGAADTGQYAAAHRIADLALIPVIAAIEAALPRFFEAGRQGFAEVRGLALRLARAPLAYSMVAAAALYLGATGLPWLLGSAYATAVPMLQGFSALLPLSCARQFARNALLGAGDVAATGGIEVGGAVASIALGVLLIPRFGWIGAVAAKALSELLLLALFVGRLQQRASSAPARA